MIFLCLLVIYIIIFLFLDDESNELQTLRRQAKERSDLGLPPLEGRGCLHIDGKTYDINGDEFVDH